MRKIAWHCREGGGGLLSVFRIMMDERQEAVLVTFVARLNKRYGKQQLVLLSGESSAHSMAVVFRLVNIYIASINLLHVRRALYKYRESVHGPIRQPDQLQIYLVLHPSTRNDTHWQDHEKCHFLWTDMYTSTKNTGLSYLPVLAGKTPFSKGALFLVCLACPEIGIRH